MQSFFSLYMIMVHRLLYLNPTLFQEYSQAKKGLLKKKDSKLKSDLYKIIPMEYKNILSDSFDKFLSAIINRELNNDNIFSYLFSTF